MAFTFPSNPVDGDIHVASDLTYKYRDGIGWEVLKPSVGAVRQEFAYVSTEGQTVISGTDSNGLVLSYDAGYVDVFVEGVKQVEGADFTAVDGVSIELVSGISVGLDVQVVASGIFDVADTYTKAAVDSITSSLDASSITTGTISDSRLPDTISSNITGNASTTNALSTARTIDITGDITATAVAFDGTSNIAISASVNDDSHNHVVSNIDGLDTCLSAKCGSHTHGASTCACCYTEADELWYPVVWRSEGTVYSSPGVCIKPGAADGEDAMLCTSRLYSCIAYASSCFCTQGCVKGAVVCGSAAVCSSYVYGTKTCSSCDYGAYQCRACTNAIVTCTDCTQASGGCICKHYCSCMICCSKACILCAVGGVCASGNVTAYSDCRVKKNIKKIENAKCKIGKLNGYTFDRTDMETPRQTGVIAQEVLEVLPEAVNGGPTEKDPEKKYGVAYGNIVGLLIEGIKEQQVELDALKECIKTK